MKILRMTGTPGTIRFKFDGEQKGPIIEEDTSSRDLRTLLTTAKTLTTAVTEKFHQALEELKRQKAGLDDAGQYTIDRFLFVLDSLTQRIVLFANTMLIHTEEDLQNTVQMRFQDDAKHLNTVFHQLRQQDSFLEEFTNLEDRINQEFMDSIQLITTISEQFTQRLGLSLEQVTPFTEQLMRFQRARIGISVDRFGDLMERLLPGIDRSEARERLFALAIRASLLRAPLSLEGLWELTEMGTFADMIAELDKLEADDRILLQPSLAERLGFTERMALPEFAETLAELGQELGSEITLEEFANLMHEFGLSNSALLDLGNRAGTLSPPCGLQKLAEEARKAQRSLEEQLTEFEMSQNE